MTEAGLFVSGATRIESHGTPRRLVVMVTHMAKQQAGRVEEMRGPPVDRAFDAQGNPSKAAEGFAKSCGVSVGELQRLNTAKGTYLCHTIHRLGLTAESLLPELMTRILEGFPGLKPSVGEVAKPVSSDPSTGCWLCSMGAYYLLPPVTDCLRVSPPKGIVLWREVPLASPISPIIIKRWIRGA